MNRVEFLKKVRLIADEPIWLQRSNMTSDLITEMQEVFDRLEELEMREDRNDYLMKQLHIQRQINYELEYNIGDEKYLEQRLHVVRARKAEAKKALNAMFADCTPEDFPVLRRKEVEKYGERSCCSWTRSITRLRSIPRSLPVSCVRRDTTMTRSNDTRRRRPSSMRSGRISSVRRSEDA